MRIGAALVVCCAAFGQGIHREPGYVKPRTCAECHQNIWDTYQRTGMARSFQPPSAANGFAGSPVYYHRASDSYFAMLQRDGKWYQRRYQLDSSGRQINVMEKQIDFIMGSGNHSRAYLTRTNRNTLIELPLAWYAEKGGYWAMNPGYDRPDHEGFRRAITYDCMFCHNGYPEIPSGNEKPFAQPVYAGSLPEGIDCQRCHGPGAKHVQLARTAGSKPQEVRRSIVNPSRLAPQRQMEVCMQCHLETTSFALPNAILRYERGPFSYRPGEPLGDFMLFFDHEPGKGRDEKFELVSAAYRLRRSACFRQSSGKMTCTTCHNPHDIPRGEEAARHYNSICRECHSSAFDRLVSSGRHTQANACIDCHMPKRRTEDVVHAVVTDHYIQRRKPNGDLLADMPERHETGKSAYRSKVVPYYPEPLPQTPENQLYVAVAQVIQDSNLTQGIAQLTAALKRYSPRRAEFYSQLAEAWRDDGHLDKALPFYREAVRRDPEFVFGLQELGAALRRSGQHAEAITALKRAVSVSPESAVSWRELGLAYQAQGDRTNAVSALEKAIAIDPDMAEARNNLGIVLMTRGERQGAESAFREAIRIQPDSADARNNLANLLAGAGEFDTARDEFESALRYHPNDAGTHYNYAMLLGRMRHFDDAQRQLEESLRTNPEFAHAHQLLGDLLMAKDQARQAIPHYREALRIQPDSGRAQVALASALMAVGDRAAAMPYLQKAAASSDPAVRDEAARLLRQPGR
jgi:tetratricopeptide (TPR) repeat protein